MRYKFINFECLSRTEKTSKWVCRNNRSGDPLGQILWYGAWRQYCFVPEAGCVFSAGCLEDVQDFISKLMNGRKAPETETAGAPY